MELEILKIYPEYLKAIFSWPIAILVLGLIFMFKFSDSIKEFLKNCIRLKAGPIEFDQKPPEGINKKIEDSLEQKGITLTKEQMVDLEEEFRKLSEEVINKDGKIQEKENFINYLMQRAELYEFLYLDYFFVPNTKLVLMWSYNVGLFSKVQFHLTYSDRIPDELERETIFNVLLQNNMIEKIDDNYTLTDKGKRFLRFQRLIK